LDAVSSLRFDVRPVAADDEKGLGELREFARANLYDRAALHADLEAPELFERSRFLRAYWEGKLAGGASVLSLERRPPSMALAGALPGAVAALLAPLEPPLRVLAVERYWPELERSGARLARSELLMVRIRRTALPESDPRLERLAPPALEQDHPGLEGGRAHLSAGPCVGLRAGNELIALGRTAWVTERLACLGHVETQAGHRGRGHATSVVSELVRALETPQRQVAIFVAEHDHAATRLLARLGFSGTRRFGVFELRV
jgi:ribosomal protein S18 acetylase RimI-like enzyme